MIIHDMPINQTKQSFQVIFTLQNSDKQDNYIILQNIISLIAPTLGIAIPTTYGKMINDINQTINSIVPQAPPKEVSLFVNCSTSGIVVGTSGRSGIDYSIVKR